MQKYVALLRGINVGGNNIIPMVKLKAAFEAMGLEEVKTYIQSGNVIFSASGTDEERLEAKIEKALSKEFNYESRVVVISEKSLKETVEKAPKGFGKYPENYRYDVIFIKPPLTPEKALAVAEKKEGVDEAAAGKHALYFWRTMKNITSSRISKIVGKPEYKFMTIRNWNTTTKLLALMEK